MCAKPRLKKKDTLSFDYSLGRARRRAFCFYSEYRDIRRPARGDISALAATHLIGYRLGYMCGGYTQLATCHETATVAAETAFAVTLTAVTCVAVTLSSQLVMRPTGR